MALTPRQMINGSMAAAGVVAAISLIDLIVGFPFSGQTVMDILFLLSAGMVIFLGYDAKKEQF